MSTDDVQMYNNTPNHNIRIKFMQISRSGIQLIIEICGWLYFLIWSVSFYPQILLILKQKSAMGMNSNYIFINLTGYVMYAMYNIYGWCEGSNPETGSIDRSDILFAMHSVLAYGFIVGLFFYYPHKLQLSDWTIVYLVVEWIVFLYFGVEAMQADKPFTLTFFGLRTSLGYIQTLGYMKMISSLLKHPPQIYYNFKRKSTKGWSIQGMIMDFLGGFFSLIALLLQFYINPHFHVNKAKLFLSVISMLYDVTYMVQHFFLYGDREEISFSSKVIKAKKQNPEEAFRKSSFDDDEERILTGRKVV